MKKLAFFLLLLSCFSPLFATEYEGPAASRIVYGAEAVRVAERTGHVQYIRFGEKAPSSLAALLEKRKPWMPAYTGNVGFRTISSFSDKLGFLHTRLQVTLDGYPIEGSVIITHERAGRLESVNGDLYALKASPAAALTEQQALQQALAHVHADRYMWERGGFQSRFSQQNLAALPHGELVYAPRGGKARDNNFALAWKFDIHALKPLSRAWVFVDAQTGEVIHRLERIHTADVPGTAITAYSGSRPLVADQTGPNAYRLREIGRGGGIATLNCQTGVDYNTAVDFTDTDNNWNNVNAQMDQYATDAHVGTETTYDYYLNRHSWNSYNNLGAPLNSYVHYDVQFGNAFWDGTQMTYGDGDGSLFSGPLTTYDVCGHEITHGVTEFTAALIYNDESGALNESFSDIFGTVIEHIGKPTNWSWLIGEECTVGNAGIRSMEDPTIFQNPRCYNGQYWVPGADVHYNSGVQNHWFYIMVEGDTGVNDLGNAYSVAALGWTKSEDIAFRNLSVYLTPSSDYADARFYAIQSATDLYGACTTEMINTANAWYAVGVGGPWNNVPQAAFVANPHSFCDAPATVNFTNNSNSGASFMWYFGDGGTSTQANPSHMYTALGSYTVKLVVTSCNGARDSIIMPNYVVLDTNIACTVVLPPTGNTTLNYCIGSVQDPGGFGDYPDNANTTVTIAPPVADYIVLTFNSFQLEDFFDYLNVYDGASTAAPLIGSYTGSQLPNGGTITSTGGTVTLEFTSDVSVTMPGFDVGFECFTVSAPPVAAFTGTPLTTCNGEVTFTDQSTNHPSTFTWDFGDGNTGSGPNPVHQYATAGTYSVTLISCNSIGCDTTVCNSCVIYDPNSPACQITTMPTTGTVTLQQCGGTVYDNGGLSDYTDQVNSVAIIAPPGASQVQISFSQFALEQGWDTLYIHDGNSTSAPLIGGYSGFNLPNNGLPIVSTGGALTLHFVTDFSVVYAGFQGMWSSTGATTGPNALFTAPTAASSGTPVNFTDQSSGAIAWAWDFGDLGTSSLQNPSHTYAAAGVYNVELKVTNSSGCEDYYYQNVYIDMVAVDDPMGMTLDLWPNPAQTQVHLKLLLAIAQDVQLEVMSPLGQVVYSESAEATTLLERVLDLSRLSKGMYFVKVKTPQGNLVRKVVLE